ncbi:MAG: hypothetical protein DRR42_18595 [Gammaproteobacteria bacterium]|nr:MAG: hypothetical protein DRR42_18595 [Gammaproteobacteria bacterium]
MYTENGQQYEELPKWVLSMILQGYTWERERTPWKRRIGLVSMPCKSVAAPLVALGALIRDLEREKADNINGHFNALCRTRDSYLENATITNGIVIDSRGNKCEFYGGDENEITVINANYKKSVRRKGRVIPNPNGPCKSFITSDNARQWRLQGASAIEINQAGNALNRKGYQFIHGCGSSILSENLQRSYTGLLLVGDGEGKDTAYMKEIYAIGFQIEKYKVSLGDLLTLHPPINGVTRIAFSNKQKIDHRRNEHYLVIADGASAFTRCLPQFRNSDVLGVYSRDEPIENLMNITSMLGELGRYYTDQKDRTSMKPLPQSIATWFLEGR